jgi:hypothetical protein
MKKLVSIIVLVLLAGLYYSCATPQRTIPSLSRERIPGPNESEVIVQNAAQSSNFPNLDKLFDIYISGELVAQVERNGSERIIVPNGNHAITLQTFGAPYKTNTVQFTANSNRTIFKITVNAGFNSFDLILSKESENALIAISTASGIEGALEKASGDVSERFTANSKVAIVYITAEDRNTENYITGELEHLLQRRGFFIVDRSDLDKIRTEQQFGMSGEVDDDTAASIGKLAGANIVITGKIDGEGNLRRLRLRALDTTSGQVVGTASERL